MKYITVLGVTGSIGMQTVDVVKNHRERFKIVAMSAGYNIEKVEEILKIIEVDIFVLLEKKMQIIYKQNIRIKRFIMGMMV